MSLAWTANRFSCPAHQLAFCPIWMHEVPFGFMQRPTRVKCTSSIQPSKSVSDNLNRWCSATYFPKWLRAMRDKVEWRVTHMTLSPVCILVSSVILWASSSRLEPRMNQMSHLFMPKPDQNNAERVQDASLCACASKHQCISYGCQRACHVLEKAESTDWRHQKVPCVSVCHDKMSVCDELGWERLVTARLFSLFNRVTELAWIQWRQIIQRWLQA